MHIFIIYKRCPIPRNRIGILKLKLNVKDESNNIKKQLNNITIKRA